MPSQSYRLVTMLPVYCCSGAADVIQATARSAEKCACAPSSMCTHSGCIHIQAALVQATWQAWSLETSHVN